MSEGKNVLVVPDDLSRILVREQLKKLGISLDVIINPDAASSMVVEMLSANDTRDEMAGIMKNSQYTGNFHPDHLLLVKNIAKEFNSFCAFHKFKALRDSTIGGLNYAFAQGPDSGGNPALQDSQREASVSINTFDKAHDLMRKTLVEMLDELKGIKEAVARTPAKLDMKSDKALLEFLSTPQFSMAELIEGLRTHFTSPRSTESVVHWPSNKAEFVDLVTKAISDTTGNRELPSISLTQLSDKARMDIARLLNPSFSVSLHGHYNANIEPFDTRAIFAALLKGLDDGSGIVNFYGLNTLSDHDKGTLRYDLQRALGKHRIKVVGGDKQLFLEGLVNALEENNTLGSYIEINGIGTLSTEDSVDLIAFLKEGLSKGSELSRGGKATARGIVETLVEALGSNEIGTVKLHNLCSMDPGVKCSLQSALKWALGWHDRLESVIVIGNHTLTLNKDDSLKIVTQLPNNTVSFVVLNADGAVMLHGPGYMG